MRCHYRWSCPSCKFTDVNRDRPGKDQLCPKCLQKKKESRMKFEKFVHDMRIDRPLESEIAGRQQYKRCPVCRCFGVHQPLGEGWLVIHVVEFDKNSRKITKQCMVLKAKEKDSDPETS